MSVTHPYNTYLALLEAANLPDVLTHVRESNVYLFSDETADKVADWTQALNLVGGPTHSEDYEESMKLAVGIPATYCSLNHSVTVQLVDGKTYLYAGGPMEFRSRHHESGASTGYCLVRILLERDEKGFVFQTHSSLVWLFEPDERGKNMEPMIRWNGHPAVEISSNEADVHAEELVTLITERFSKSHALLAYTHRPKQFHLQEAPAQPRKPGNKNKKAERIHERFVIRVLDPGEMVALYAQRESLGGTHASPIPHIRKTHLRTYRNERYKFMRGKTRKIAEMKINVKPGEAFTANKHVYLVMKAGDDNPAEGLEL